MRLAVQGILVLTLSSFATTASAGPWSWFMTRRDVARACKASPELARVYSEAREAASKGQWKRTLGGTTLGVAGAGAGYFAYLGYLAGRAVIAVPSGGASLLLELAAGGLFARHAVLGSRAKRAARYAVLDELMSNSAYSELRSSSLSNTSIKWYVGETEKAKDKLIDVQQQLDAQVRANTAARADLERKLTNAAGAHR